MSEARALLDHIRRAVPPRPRLVLQPDRCALLVIDMLRYFTHPSGRCYLALSAPIVPRIAALLEAWRAAGGLVVFTRHCHQGPHDLGMLGRFFTDWIRCGEPESELLPELAPEADEVVVRKTTYDAFLGTPLQSILEERGAQQVLITGVLTHMCCETTARSAFCRGFEVYVPVDAVASSTEAFHRGSLLGMASSVAVPTCTEDVLDLCRQ